MEQPLTPPPPDTEHPLLPEEAVSATPAPQDIAAVPVPPSAAEEGEVSDSLPPPSSLANTLHLQKIELPPLRTYKSDVSEAVKKGKETTASIFSAEEARRYEEGGGKGVMEESFILGFRTKTSALAVLFGVALLALGGGFFIFTLLQRNVPPQITTSAQALIFVNKETKINVDNLSRAELEKKVTAAQKEEVPLNNILAITFTREQSGLQGQAANEEIVKISELLPLFAIEMPPDFPRALGDDYLYGVYSFGENIPFLITKVRSYENAFAALLEWEKTMAILRDFKVLLGTNRLPPLAIKEFADILIRNRDVRAIYDEEKAPILYYSFVDKETLVFTSDKTTFDELLNRLATPKRTLR